MEISWRSSGRRRGDHDAGADDVYDSYRTADRRRPTHINTDVHDVYMRSYAAGADGAVQDCRTLPPPPHSASTPAQALTVPCKTIANNAGAEGAVVVGKLLESAEANFGFNAQASPRPAVRDTRV